MRELSSTQVEHGYGRNAIAGARWTMVESRSAIEQGGGMLHDSGGCSCLAAPTRRFNTDSACAQKGRAREKGGGEMERIRGHLRLIRTSLL